MLLYPAKGDPAGPINTGAKPIRRRRGHRFPLIVFSHGYLANGPAYASVLANFVRRGYVVAAPTFPLSSAGAPGGPKGGDYVNQPADVSFVLTKVLHLARVSPGLRRAIDRHESASPAIRSARSRPSESPTTAAASIPGSTRRASGRAPCSPSRWQLFPEQTPPFLFVHGEADATLPYSGSAAGYAGRRRRRRS